MAITQTALADLASSFIFTDTDNAATIAGVKSASTVVHAIDIDNTANSATTFVKLYNVASGSVTVGTTAPDMILPIPASTRSSFIIPGGLTFATALSVASVTTGGTAGTTGPTSDVVVRIVYV